MFSCSFSKNVDDHVKTIHQYPLSVIVPFHMGGAQACLFQTQIDGIGDGFDLPITLTRCDDKEIRKCLSITKVEYD